MQRTPGPGALYWTHWAPESPASLDALATAIEREFGAEAKLFADARTYTPDEQLPGVKTRILERPADTDEMHLHELLDWLGKPYA